jgi:hypothetical protein
MAKAKKSETTGASAPREKTAKTKSSAPAGAPLVDTNLAAQAAAKRVVAGVGPASVAGSAPVSESSTFKHLKDSLNKPHVSGLENVLDKTAAPGQKRPNLPFNGGKQTGRNQTFGADVNRAGVPRRTGGG